MTAEQIKNYECCNGGVKGEYLSDAVLMKGLRFHTHSCPVYAVTAIGRCLSAIQWDYEDLVKAINFLQVYKEMS